MADTQFAQLVQTGRTKLICLTGRTKLTNSDSESDFDFGAHCAHFRFRNTFSITVQIFDSRRISNLHLTLNSNGIHLQNCGAKTCPWWNWNSHPTRDCTVKCCGKCAYIVAHPLDFTKLCAHFPLHNATWMCVHLEKTISRFGNNWCAYLLSSTHYILKKQSPDSGTIDVPTYLVALMSTNDNLQDLLTLKEPVPVIRTDYWLGTLKDVETAKHKLQSQLRL
jgi:hypothetical protein